MSTAKLKGKTKTIESYYQTNDDWHNHHVIKVIASIKEVGLFDDLSAPLDLYNLGVDSFHKMPHSPLKVIGLLDKGFTKQKTNNEQSIFIFEWVDKYLRNSTFEDDEPDDTTIMDETKDSFLEIFKAELNYRKGELESSKPKPPEIKNIRTGLKEIMQNELEKLPEYLQDLEPKDKLNFICKLMPFVMPKVASIHPEKGEPGYDNRSFF